MPNDYSPTGRGDTAGVLAAAIFGFLGIFAAGQSGTAKTVMISVALAGLILCCVVWFLSWYHSLLPRALRYLRYRERCRTAYFHFDIKAAILNESHVAVFLYLPNWRSVDRDATQAWLTGMPRLRCQVNRRWSRKRHVVIPKVLGPGRLVAEFPEALTVMSNGKRRINGGPYIIRWKIDDKRLALARRTVTFDGTQYIEHRVLRILGTPQRIRRFLEAKHRELVEAGY